MFCIHALRRCSNYIFILDLTPGFNGLRKDNCNTRRESLKFCDLVRVISEISHTFNVDISMLGCDWVIFEILQTFNMDISMLGCDWNGDDNTKSIYLLFYSIKFECTVASHWFYITYNCTQSFSYQSFQSHRNQECQMNYCNICSYVKNVFGTHCADDGDNNLKYASPKILSAIIYASSHLLK